MTVVKGYFDELHFTESNIEKFDIVGSDIVVHILSGLEIYGSHPLSSTHQRSEPCQLRFKNVVLSQLIIDEYAGNPNQDGFKERREIIHQLDNLEQSDIKYEDYSLEGILQDPQAWIDWYITAEEFYLDDLKGETNVTVTLDPDVAEVFTSAEAVNTALRYLLAAIPK